MAVQQEKRRTWQYSNDGYRQDGTATIGQPRYIATTGSLGQDSGGKKLEWTS
jgi:hypothetical protein